MKPTGSGHAGDEEEERSTVGEKRSTVGEKRSTDNRPSTDEGEKAEAVRKW